MRIQIQDLDVTIRPETPQDYRTVEEMTRDAFWNQYFPGCDEHYTAHTLRAHPDFMQELDWVAEIDGRIVGNIMYTRSRLEASDGTRLDTVTFGPVCVTPDLQRRGIGGTLIRHTLELATAQGAPAVIILGDPHNYCLHGFRNGKDLGIADHDGRYPFGMLAKELREGALAGKAWKYRYSDAYTIDQDAVRAFDATFAPRTAEWKPSQEVFSMMVRAHLE